MACLFQLWNIQVRFCYTSKHRRFPKHLDSTIDSFLLPNFLKVWERGKKAPFTHLSVSIHCQPHHHLYVFWPHFWHLPELEGLRECWNKFSGKRHKVKNKSALKSQIIQILIHRATLNQKVATKGNKFWIRTASTLC